MVKTIAIVLFAVIMLAILIKAVTELEAGIKQRVRLRVQNDPVAPALITGVLVGLLWTIALIGGVAILNHM